MRDLIEQLGAWALVLYTTSAGALIGIFAAVLHMRFQRASLIAYGENVGYAKGFQDGHKAGHDTGVSLDVSDASSPVNRLKKGMDHGLS